MTNLVSSFFVENLSIIERPDQGHLYPLGEPRDTCHTWGVNLRPPAPQARTPPKELSRQLIAGYSEPLLGAQRPAATVSGTLTYLSGYFLH